MATTTPALIKANIISDLEALTPTALPSYSFAEADPRHRLVEVAKNTLAWFRKFEVLQDDSGVEVVDHGNPVYRNESYVVLVIYPRLPQLYQSTGGLSSLRDLMRIDSHQLRDAIRDPDNYLSAVNERTAPTFTYNEELEFWIMEMTFDVAFYESSTV